jgi:fimbrial isopeptide formation D2 family protein/LPXTG-motif cell wall-anchored protein
MKKMKKMLALALAIVMTLAMGVTAFAADGHTITVSSTDTHTYKIYQVLTGTLSEEGSKQLGDPAWGADAIADPGDVNEFIASITAAGLSDQDIAQLVAAKVDTTKGHGPVDKDHPATGLATGYYVLIDNTTLEKYGENPEKIDTKALNVIYVVNDIDEMAIKWGTTEDKKEIVSDTLGKDGEGEVNSINGAKDNVSVGDTVNYKITAKVPANASEYNYFYFVINDTLDKGLTFTDGSIKVYKDSVADANLLTEGTVTGSGTEQTVSGDYLLKTGEAAKPNTFQVALTDAKAHAGEDIIVTYSAVLNKDAVIGETPNKNTSTVTYSNNPNHDYDGNNYPGFPNEKDKDALGETPKTETETYTTGIEIQKVDENGAPLTGATFQISGQSTKTVLTVSEKFEADDDGDYYKLKNGKYTKEAPTTDPVMEEAPAGATEGYVEDENGDTEVGGKKYRAYVPETDEGKTVYIKVNGNSDQYENGKYKKTVETKTENTATNHTVALAVDDNGIVRFDGLGAGTYTITETATPQGYNTIAPFDVTVSFDADGTPKWSFTGSGSYDQGEGVYKIEIENNKGTELPETGGIGTTLFYVTGAILVICAGVVLVTRRRMNA